MGWSNVGETLGTLQTNKMMQRKANWKKTSSVVRSTEGRMKVEKFAGCLDKAGHRRGVRARPPSGVERRRLGAVENTTYLHCRRCMFEWHQQSFRTLVYLLLSSAGVWSPEHPLDVEAVLIVSHAVEIEPVLWRSRIDLHDRINKDPVLFKGL